MTTFLEMIVYLLQVNNPLWPTGGVGWGWGGGLLYFVSSWSDQTNTNFFKKTNATHI